MIERIGQGHLTGLYDVAAVRQIEQASFAIEGDSFPMMERAAYAIYRHICHRQPSTRPIVVLAGGGNNGGDGVLVAVLLHEAGIDVTLFDAAKRPRTGDALLAWEKLRAVNVPVQPAEAFLAYNRSAVVVDALLGIGALGHPSSDFAALIDHCNHLRQSGGWTLAVDVPSGLNANTGSGSTIIEADMVVTFIVDKIGLRINKGPACCHEIVIESLQAADLDLPQCAHFLTRSFFRTFQPCTRYGDSHKGTYGHVAVLGGDHGFGGAAIMSSEAAARAGAGTVALYSRGVTIGAALCRNPSIMGFDEAQGEPGSVLRGNSSIIVLGPGLGRLEWGHRLFDAAAQLHCRTVLDADGLRLLASKRWEGGELIITPHPGEAAFLLGISIDEVLNDLISAAEQLAQKYRAVVILKGITSVIAKQGEVPVVVGAPCPGLARGGSGDVLTGIVAACWAYYQDAFTAAVIGAGWHNDAAIKCAQEKGDIGMFPQELLMYLQKS